MARIAAGREADHLYRGFPFHPFHHPPPDGKGFGDRYGNELDLRHLQPDTARRSSVGPSERPGLHDTPFLDSHPFTREGFHGNLPRVERGGGGEREWQRRDLAALVNGEYKPAGKDNLPSFLQCFIWAQAASKYYLILGMISSVLYSKYGREHKSECLCTIFLP